MHISIVKCSVSKVCLHLFRCKKGSIECAWMCLCMCGILNRNGEWLCPCICPRGETCSARIGAVISQYAHRIKRQQRNHRTSVFFEFDIHTHTHTLTKNLIAIIRTNIFEREEKAARQPRDVKEKTIANGTHTQWINAIFRAVGKQKHTHKKVVCDTGTESRRRNMLP